MKKVLLFSLLIIFAITTIGCFDFGTKPKDEDSSSPQTTYIEKVANRTFYVPENRGNSVFSAGDIIKFKEDGNILNLGYYLNDSSAYLMGTKFISDNSSTRGFYYIKTRDRDSKDSVYDRNFERYIGVELRDNGNTLYAAEVNRHYYSRKDGKPYDSGDELSTNDIVWSQAGLEAISSTYWNKKELISDSNWPKALVGIYVAIDMAIDSYGHATFPYIIIGDNVAEIKFSEFYLKDNLYPKREKAVVEAKSHTYLSEYTAEKSYIIKLSETDYILFMAYNDFSNKNDIYRFIINTDGTIKIDTVKDYKTGGRYSYLELKKED